MGINGLNHTLFNSNRFLYDPRGEHADTKTDAAHITLDTLTDVFIH